MGALDPEELGDDFWKRPVTMISTVALPAGEESSAQQLYVDGFRYVFPLEVRGHRAGVALLGFKFDEEPLDGDDLDLVRGLLNQASLAIENAALLEEVRKRLDQVVELVDVSRHLVAQIRPRRIAHELGGHAQSRER